MPVAGGCSAERFTNVWNQQLQADARSLCGLIRVRHPFRLHGYAPSHASPVLDAIPELGLRVSTDEPTDEPIAASLFAQNTPNSA